MASFKPEEQLFARRLLSSRINLSYYGSIFECLFEVTWPYIYNIRCVDNNGFSIQKNDVYAEFETSFHFRKVTFLDISIFIISILILPESYLVLAVSIWEYYLVVCLKEKKRLHKINNLNKFDYRKTYTSKVHIKSAYQKIKKAFIHSNLENLEI